MLLPNKNWLRPCGSMLFVSIANLRARRSYLLALSHFFVVDASSSTPQTKPIFRMKIITRLSPCVFCRCVILCSRTNYRPKRKSRLPCFFFVHVSSSAPCTNFRYMLACFFLFWMRRPHHPPASQNEISPPFVVNASSSAPRTKYLHRRPSRNARSINM